MPIKSYIAYPVDGKYRELKQELEQISHCEVSSVQDKDVLILVTDTIGKADEDTLQSKIETLTSLQCLALVSGFDDPLPENNTEEQT